MQGHYAQLPAKGLSDSSSSRRQHAESSRRLTCRLASYSFFGDNTSAGVPPVVPTSIRTLHILILTAFVFSTIISILPAQGRPFQSASSLVIQGTVINAVTNDPVPRALVTTNDNRFATLSDANGRFEFAIPEPRAGATSESFSSQEPSDTTNVALVQAVAVRSMSFTARKPGFLQGESVSTTVHPSTHDVIISLTPEALIVGHVSLPSADPAEGVGVELYRREVRDGRARWIPVGNATARSNGEFRFAELYPGTYKLFTREMLERDPGSSNPREQLYGYPPVYYPAASDLAGAAAIELSPGKTFEANLGLSRQPYYPVRVPVANLPSGTFMRVEVSVQGHPGPGYSLGFDPRNQLITGSLPSGNYTLQGFAMATPASTGTVNISPKGAPVAGPAMSMVPSSSIRVNIKEDFTTRESNAAEDLGAAASVVTQDPEAGSIRKRPTPRDYINIQLRPAEDFAQDRGTFLHSAEPDTLWLDNVLAGRYWVEVHSARGYVASLTSGVSDLLHNPLVVGQGASVPALEITLRDDSGRIEGALETASPSSGDNDDSFSAAGFPVASGLATALRGPRAYVYFVPLPDSNGVFLEMPVSADGQFSSPELPPGNYRVLAFKRPNHGLEFLNPEAMRAYEFEGVLVRLGPGGKETVRLHISERKN